MIKCFFGDLCENHLKPHVVKCSHIRSTTYLGGTALQTPQTKPRLLIVTLTCEEQVAELMHEAKLLRNFSNNYVATCIYLNKDLTKEESAALFKRRVARRNAKRSSEAEGKVRTNPVQTRKTPHIDHLIASATGDADLC